MTQITKIHDLTAKAAQDLASQAEAAGWVWVAANGLDSGGWPFLKVLIGNKVTGEQYKITWHTRGTGTYRLFGKLHCEAHGYPWRDAPSLRAIKTRLAL